MSDIFKRWIIASRPKTLIAGASPVIVAIGLAVGDDVFDPLLSAMAMAVAILFQIASNFANDYFDYRKGADNDSRVGPKRAVAQGWITPRQMLIATIIVITIASSIGLYFVFVVNWHLIFIGVVIAIFAIAYSGGRYPLAYNGLGDVCVLLFYGIVPVVFTYYIQARGISWQSFVGGCAIGFASTNILIANNYRDFYTDRLANKRTTVVIFGKQFGEWLYFINGLIAVALSMFLLQKKSTLTPLLPLVYLTLTIQTWKKMKTINRGERLIEILGQSARNTFILSLLILLGLILGRIH